MAGDTLVVTKLDRFARSAVEGIQTDKTLFVTNLYKKNNLSSILIHPKVIKEKRRKFREKV